jgi:hypothetical protein
MPLGVASGIAYIGVVVIAANIMTTQNIFLFGVCASFLIVLGAIFSEADHLAVWKALVNRIFTLMTLWLSILILIRVKLSEKSLRASLKQTKLLRSVALAANHADSVESITEYIIRETRTYLSAPAGIAYIDNIDSRMLEENIFYSDFDDADVACPQFMVQPE